LRSAAWRISLWAALAFAAGTMVVFLFLHQFVANDMRRRSDAWLTGEAGVLRDVARRTPRDAVYGRLVREVAELATREVPQRLDQTRPEDAVFFLETTPSGAPALWVGTGDGVAAVDAIRRAHLAPNVPVSLAVAGFDAPFRVVCVPLDAATSICLGLSERDELRVLGNLRLRFALLWLLIVSLGSAIVFLSTRRVLRHIRDINDAAARIGEDDLGSRVPTTSSNDETGQLALTLNRMLERIERSVRELHTITGSLAHDIRSPLTAVRARLEMSLTARDLEEQTDSVVTAIEDMDRLTEFLNQSLDVAEARANALRLNRTAVDLDETLRVLIGLYEAAMSEKGIAIHLRGAGPVTVLADAALMQRMLANLFDNEIKHLPPGCTVSVLLRQEGDGAVLAIEDDGPGFDPSIAGQVFERRVKGAQSRGYGLGLAFVAAVVRAHAGTVQASNRAKGGAHIEIRLPLAADHASRPVEFTAMAK
jgi:signal transduction histidine kinase